MKVIGITGGVGAGKTTILEYMEKECQAMVLQADKIAHGLMEPSGACYPELVQVLPKEVFAKDGRIDRKILANLLFSQKKLREIVNGIVHPAVKVYIIDVIGREREKNTIPYLVVEAALLIEEGYHLICDEMWYVYVSRENRKERLVKNRGYTEQKIENIFASQLSEEEYFRYCSQVIDNNGTREEAWLQVKKALEKKGDRE